MRRSVLVALALLACAAAGGLAATFVSGVSAAGLLTTGTTTTGTTTTNPGPALIPPGVTISGIPVGGLTAEEAAGAVGERFELPLTLVLDRRHRLAPTPEALGASAHVDEVVARALASQAGTALTLPVLINGDVTRAYVFAVARRFNRPPRDAQVFLRRGRPVIVPNRPGRTIDRLNLTQKIVARLRATSRARIRMKTRASSAVTTRRDFRAVIVIHRGSNRLFLYRFDRLRRTFRVATGQSVYPTPLGKFSIVVKWRNPWWYPPNSRWAQGQKPIPPGPNNPLGTRWMGLSASGVGIHGTPNPGSIGYSVSHGCIRMYISDAEWLFGTVYIGTTVFIVAT